MSALYRTLLTQLSAGQRCLVLSDLTNGTKTLLPPTLAIARDRPESELISRALETGLVHVDLDGRHGAWLVEPYRPDDHLVIMGGGHLAVPLCELGAQLGFAVTVVDDRPSFANMSRFHRARQVICADFATSFSQLSFGLTSFVVIMTRGHRHDLTCLRQALYQHLPYLGVIASRRRAHAMREQLLADGFSDEQVAKIHSPVGLSIGAVTPVEIALSIMAEIIAVKRLGSAAPIGRHGTQWSDDDRTVLVELAHTQETPCALATIVARRGSVPRGIGAKMLVRPDGTIVGSIGGGCGEAEVIRVAREVIEEGRFRLHHLDLTDEVAEDEGMVCGGTMDLLIERWDPKRWAPGRWGPAINDQDREQTAALIRDE